MTSSSHQSWPWWRRYRAEALDWEPRSRSRVSLASSPRRRSFADLQAEHQVSDYRFRIKPTDLLLEMLASTFPVENEESMAVWRLAFWTGESESEETALCLDVFLMEVYFNLFI